MDRKPVFTDYLTILLKWKKFILINLAICLIVGIAVAFLIPKQFKATGTIMIPSENMGLGGLAGLIGNKSSVASFGAKLFGVSNSSEDFLLGILNSRTALEKVVNVFDLKNYYDTKNIDETLRAFRADLNFELNEYGFIELSVINENPQTSANIVNYFVNLLDSLNIEFNIEQAKNNRTFIEKRYLKNVDDLRFAEDSLFNFQKKYGIVAVPEQFEVSVKAAAEIESKLAQSELSAFLIKSNFGENSPQFRIIDQEAKILKEKVEQLKKDSGISQKSNILFPFKNMPDISMKYLRYKREIEIQQAIMEVILPLYEQAKIEEQKSIPTIISVDKAMSPKLKDSPKRAFIIGLFLFLGCLFSIPFVFVGEKLTTKREYPNSFEQKFSINIIKLKKLFGIKD
jgi:tyrosine-protein kinase Etk/Wzc